MDAVDDIAEDYERLTGNSKQDEAVDRIEPLFDRFKAAVDPGKVMEDQENLADFLADIMLWVHDGGALDFDAALVSAENHFNAEHQ